MQFMPCPIVCPWPWPPIIVIIIIIIIIITTYINKPVMNKTRRRLLGIGLFIAGLITGLSTPSPGDINDLGDNVVFIFWGVVFVVAVAVTALVVVATEGETSEPGQSDPDAPDAGVPDAGPE